MRIGQATQVFLFRSLLHRVTPPWFSLAVALVFTGLALGRRSSSCLMFLLFMNTGFGTFGKGVVNLVSLAAAATVIPQDCCQGRSGAPVILNNEAVLAYCLCVWLGSFPECLMPGDKPGSLDAGLHDGTAVAPYQ